jgi:hypothetical protein
MVPVGALVAEREKARRVTEERLTKEQIEPLKARAAQFDQQTADLQALQPHLDYLKAHPDLLTREQPPAIQAVSDEDAERVARQYELYSGSGLDLARAKRIIADRREEMTNVARETAREVVQPYAAQVATDASRTNFVWAAQEAQRRGVDPKLVADLWTKVDPTLTQHRQVAEHILRVALGEAAVSGTLQQASQFEPVFTEPAGGRRAQAPAVSDLEKRVARSAGISEADWTKSVAAFRPDAVNVLGE